MNTEECKTKLTELGILYEWDRINGVDRWKCADKYCRFDAWYVGYEKFVDHLVAHHGVYKPDCAPNEETWNKWIGGERTDKKHDPLIYKGGVMPEPEKDIKKKSETKPKNRPTRKYKTSSATIRNIELLKAANVDYELVTSDTYSGPYPEYKHIYKCNLCGKNVKTMSFRDFKRHLKGTHGIDLDNGGKTEKRSNVKVPGSKKIWLLLSLGPFRKAELSKLLKLRTATIDNYISVFEKKGFVSVDSGDNKTYKLTKKGEEASKKIISRYPEAMEDIRALFHCSAKKDINSQVKKDVEMDETKKGDMNMKESKVETGSGVSLETLNTVIGKIATEHNKRLMETDKKIEKINERLDTLQRYFDNLNQSKGQFDNEVRSLIKETTKTFFQDMRDTEARIYNKLEGKDKTTTSFFSEPVTVCTNCGKTTLWTSSLNQSFCPDCKVWYEYTSRQDGFEPDTLYNHKSVRDTFEQIYPENQNKCWLEKLQDTIVETVLERVKDGVGSPMVEEIIPKQKKSLWKRSG